MRERVVVSGDSRAEVDHVVFELSGPVLGELQGAKGNSRGRIGKTDGVLGKSVSSGGEHEFEPLRPALVMMERVYPRELFAV